MSFKIIADILTVPFEGDFTGDMDPSLKKAFGERWEEKKKYIYRYIYIYIPSNGSELEKLNTPKFIAGLDEKEKSSLCRDVGSREGSTKQSGYAVQKNLLIVVQNVFIERKASGISWVIVCRTCIHTGRVSSVESNHLAHRLCGEANQGWVNTWTNLVRETVFVFKNYVVIFDCVAPSPVIYNRRKR